MNFTLGLFYLFSFILLSSSLVVVSTRNAIYSVMFLVLAFINASALFVILGAEFLAMLLIVVYVGAIAVLFLFVVMMLNVDVNQIKEKTNRNLPILVLVAIILFSEIFLMIKFSSTQNSPVSTLYPISSDISNIESIGNILYTDFVLQFQLAGAILFVAMIGAIVLTIREEKTRLIKKQVIFTQTSRNKENSIEIIKVKSGEGIKIWLWMA